MTTWDFIATTWRWDIVALALAAAAPIAFSRMGRVGHTWPRALALAGAVLAFVLALSSPVATLADGTLFSAHMLQHLILALVVPPLLLLAFGGGSRRRVPAPLAWAMGVGAMWLWHIPALCNAAATSEVLQRVQHVSLLAMGTAFWWPVLGASRRIAPLGAVLYLFSACLACTLLGITITLSPVAVCSVYMHPRDALGILPTVRQGWGLTPERDQQLGGLLMWVPACMVYLAAILASLRRFYRAPAAEAVVS